MRMENCSEHISCARLMHLVFVLKRPIMLNKLIGTRTKTKYGARGNGLLILFLPPVPPPPSPSPIQCWMFMLSSVAGFAVGQQWLGRKGKERVKSLEQRQRNNHDSEFCTSVSRYDLSRIVGDEYYLSNKLSFCSITTVISKKSGMSACSKYDPWENNAALWNLSLSNIGPT